MTEAISAWNTSLAECMPIGRRLMRYRPNEVILDDLPVAR